MGLIQNVARALETHRSFPMGSCHCACGWIPALMLNDTESDRGQLRRHQAEVVVAALKECTHCEGSGRSECEIPWCTDQGHAGQCGFCAGTGEMEK